VDADAAHVGRERGTEWCADRDEKMKKRFRNRLDPANEAVYGPQHSIAIPGGAIIIGTTDDPQTVINAHSAGTVYGFTSGAHNITSAITPKSGDTFVGEYGAVLEGINWSTSDGTQGAFRAAAADNIDNVTVRNLSIQRMPQRGIALDAAQSSGWLIEYCEVGNGRHTGVELCSNSTLRYCSIHHNITATPDDPVAANRGGGYGGFNAVNVLFDSNEIAYNGAEQKIGGVLAVGGIFRNNWVHHNHGDGIWFDTVSNMNALIEGNRCEDNGRDGISIEDCKGGCTIRSNSSDRNQEGLLIYDSQDLQVTNNRFYDNSVDGVCFQCGDRIPPSDVANNGIYDNTFHLLTAGVTFGIILTGSIDLTPYFNPATKGNLCDRNSYLVPNTSSIWFLWNGSKSFTSWQGVPQDANGSISIG
jgi:parallel beta-helix repeat protein